MRGIARVGAAAIGVLAFGIGVEEAWSQSPTDIGVRLGFTVSTVRFQDPATDSQTGTLVGPHAEVLLRRKLGRLFSVGIGLQVAREGFGRGGAHTGALQQDRLAVPLLVQVRTPHRISVHAAAGLAGKVAVRCRQVGVYGANEAPCDDPVMTAPWRRLDVAGIGVLGVSVPWGRRTLATDARLLWGLRDLDGGLFIPGSARSLALEISFTILSPWRTADAGGDL